MILQSVPPLPESSLPVRMLFENPWPLTVAIGVVAILVAQQLITRAKVRWAAGAFAAGAVAATGLVLMAGAVTTDREAIRAISSRLIDGIVGVANASGPDPVAEGVLAEILSERVDLISVPSAPPSTDAPGFVDLIQRRLRGGNTVQEHRVRETQATTDGPDVGRSHVLVRVTPTATGRPINSSWRFGWQRVQNQSPETWRLVSIELLALDGWADGMR